MQSVILNVPARVSRSAAMVKFEMGFGARLLRFWKITQREPKPWYMPAARTPADVQIVHRYAAHARRARFNILQRVVVMPMIAMNAVLFAVAQSFRVTRDGPAKLRTFAVRARIAWISWRHNHDVFELIAFGLLEKNAVNPDLMLGSSVTSACNLHLSSKESRAVLNDKASFATFCGDQEIPTPEVFAIYEGGAPKQAFSNAAPPSCDLYVKPILGNRGQGSVWWRFDGGYRPFGDHTSGRASEKLSASEFVETVASLSVTAATPVLVQRAVSPHPALTPDDDVAAMTLRIFTGRWPDDRIQVLSAQAQIPKQNESISHGGQTRLLDGASGMVLPVMSAEDPLTASFQSTNAVFDNLTMPHWPKTIACVEKLHLALPGPSPIVGWDVIISKDGPFIVEGNSSITPIFEQIVTKRPAGDGVWSRLYAAYLS